jgi:hypothetical protein
LGTLSASQWTANTSLTTNQLAMGGSNYWVQDALKTWSFTNPGGDNTTLRFEVRPGDIWSSDSSGVERSEISGSTTYSPGTPIHIAYNWMVEPGPTNDANWLVAGQLHTVVSNGISPPFAIYMSGDKMMIRVDEAGANANAYSYYKTIYTDTTNIVRGHTYAMQIDANFDPVNGYLHVVRDGVTLADYHGPLGYANMGSFYWKEGIYRASTTTSGAASDTTIAMDYSHLSITTGSTPAATPPTTTTATTTTTTASTAPTTTAPVATAPVATAPVATAPATVALAPTGLADAAIVGGYVNKAADTASQALTGNAQAGATVTVYDGATKLGSTVAASTGHWSYTLGHLADGAHSLTATATNAAGQVSAKSAALALTVDTVAPSPAVQDIVYNATTKLTAITGSSAAGSHVTVTDNNTVIGTATANASGAWTLNAKLSATGVQSITLNATDAAGNAGASGGTTFYDQSGGVHFVGYGGDNVEIGANRDTLTGGGGHDLFVFNPKFGLETVSDFDPTNDKIAFDHTLFSSPSAVLQHAAQVGADTAITYDGSDKVTLHNVTLGSLHAANFVVI